MGRQNDSARHIHEGNGWAHISRFFAPLSLPPPFPFAPSSSPSTPRNVPGCFLDRGNMVPCLWRLNRDISDTLWRLDRGNMIPRGDCYRRDDWTGGRMVRCGGGGDGVIAVPGASLNLPGGEGTILYWWVCCARVFYRARWFGPRSEGRVALGPLFLSPPLSPSLDRVYMGAAACERRVCVFDPAPSLLFIVFSRVTKAARYLLQHTCYTSICRQQL